MHIRTERDDLADVLTRAARAIGPLPILQGLLCEAVGNELRITGTDAETTIQTTLKVEVLEEGRILIPGKLATDAVKRLPAGLVTLAAADGEVTIAGDGSQFKLQTMTIDDFPASIIPDTSNGFNIDSEVFIKALDQVGIAASTDWARPTLTGVLFEKTDDGLRLVATDSYRLAICDLPGMEGPATALVPLRALRKLNRSIIDEPMRMSITDQDATFATRRGSLTTRVIQAKFPNYHSLIPNNYPSRLVVNRLEFVSAIRRASLVDDNIRLRLHSGGIELSTIRREAGRATEHVDGKYTGEGMTIAFDTRFLMSGIKAVTSDKVVLETSDPLKPALIHGQDEKNFRYLLMPVNL